MNTDPQAAQPQERDQLLRPERVADMVGCSARTLRRMVADRQLPKPVELGRLRRWRESEIRAWLDGTPGPDSHSEATEVPQ